ncbi:peptide methionine sulfoxide reductase-like, partial [Lytechinus variegatus]|uniref:peptide methionine sulfoxide reductase-like n=1 Tax=Lytechinus variegatus TaxID=7654 RepID=UPI001BB1D7DA
FWFPEAQFGCAPGVVRTKVGYTGGSKKFPTYYSLGDHTETVQIEFDRTKTSYEKLLRKFWANHDSTTCHKNQYMSAIFYHGEKQKEVAESTRDEHQKTVKRQIQTKIKPAETFYDAEDYHQKYMLRQHRSLFQSLIFKPNEEVSSYTAARLNGYLGGFGKLKDFEAELESLGLSDEQEQYVRAKVKGGGLN